MKYRRFEYCKNMKYDARSVGGRGYNKKTGLRLGPRYCEDGIILNVVRNFVLPGSLAA